MSRYVRLTHKLHNLTPTQQRDITHILRPLHNHNSERPAIDIAADNMRDARTAWPSTPSGPSGKGTISDPTFSRIYKKDIGTQALHNLDHAIATRNTRTIRQLVDAWTPHPATPQAIHATRHAIRHDCDHCRALGLPTEHARSDTPTNINGRLPIPLRLCQTHYDYGRNHGHLPTRTEHDAGQQHHPRRPQLIYTR